MQINGAVWIDGQQSDFSALGFQCLERIQELRDALWNTLRGALPDIQLNGPLSPRLPGNLNMSFPRIEGQHLLADLRDHVSVSMGSACTSAKDSPSHVLSALGVSPELIHSSLRFGLGRFTTADEVAYAAGRVITAARR